MNGEKRHYVANLLSYLLLTLLALVYIAPVLYMVVGSLKPDDRVLGDAGSLLAFVPVEGSLQNYRDVLARVNFPRFLFNSVLVTGLIVVAGLVVNSLAGYALARLTWRGRTAVLSVVLALLVLPFETIAVPLFYQMCVFGWRESYHVQVVPFIADVFSIYLFYSFFIGMPREVEEAGRIDGAGPWRIFFFIIMPMARPVFATVAVLTFIMRWGSYLWPLMVTTGETYRPLPVAMAAFENQVKLWGDIMAFGVMMVLPVLLIFLFCQQWFVEGVSAGRRKL